MTAYQEFEPLLGRDYMPVDAIVLRPLDSSIPWSEIPPDLPPALPLPGLVTLHATVSGCRWFDGEFEHYVTWEWVAHKDEWHDLFVTSLPKEETRRHRD